MKAIRLVSIQYEDVLRLGLFGWRATAYGDLIALVRAGPSGRVAAIPIQATIIPFAEKGTGGEGLESKAALLLRFADALVALSRAELIRLLLRDAACAALMRLNPLADCARVEWALDSDDAPPPSPLQPRSPRFGGSGRPIWILWGRPGFPGSCWPHKRRASETPDGSGVF